jgi:hypothetical protein
MDALLITKESTGISFCMAPLVPMRTISNEVRVSFCVLALRSILTNASSSLRTMSILSVPIPVEITVSRLPL